MCMCVCVQVRGKSNRFNQKTLAFTRWQKFFTIGCCSSSDALYLLVIYARPRVLAVDNWQAHPRLIYIYILRVLCTRSRKQCQKSCLCIRTSIRRVQEDWVQSVLIEIQTNFDKRAYCRTRVARNNNTKLLPFAYYINRALLLQTTSWFSTRPLCTRGNVIISYIDHCSGRVYFTLYNNDFFFFVFFPFRSKTKETTATTRPGRSFCRRWRHKTNRASTAYCARTSCWCSTVIRWWTARSSSAPNSTIKTPSR